MRKSVLTSNQTTVTLSMPISKVDVQNRIVSGFATLDNVDKQGDRITPTANIGAFQSFRGNIREMHMSIAAGRLVGFEESMYYDEETEKFYSGIFVNAYVSKGAEDTWEKVLDGTLTGFSIGGGVLDYHMEIDPDTGNQVRVITKYELTELSLVDNPANQLANVVSITKMDNGERVLKGMVAEVDPQTIFFCPTDNLAIVAKGEDHDCTNCGGHMENIGWCESSGEEMMQDMQKAITSRMTAVSNLEGGANMTVKNTDNDKAEVAEVKSQEDVTVDTAAAEDEDQTTEVDTEAVESEPEPEVEGEAVPAEEDEGNEDLSEVLDQFQSRLMKAIEDGQAEHAEKVDELKKSLGEIEGKFSSKFDELEGKLSALESVQAELDKSFKAVQDSVSDVQKGLTVVDSTTAIKKSVDNDQSAEDDDDDVQKSVWGGVFLNTIRS